MNKKVKLLLAGDLWVVPNMVNLHLDLQNYCYTIFNLETPILDKVGLPEAQKAGPYICGFKNDFFRIQKHLGNANFSIANNHIMDYKSSGMISTMQTISQSNMSFFGAGENISHASKPIFLKKENIKICLVAFAEQQFGGANVDKPGYNPLSDRIFSQITMLKDKCDYLILSVHAACEMSPIPSPEWQNTCKTFIDLGADIVYGHHAHVPQGYEKYKKGWIFYGLGNFLVDIEKWQKYPHTSWSITPEIILDNNGITVNVKYVYIEKNEDNIDIFFSKDKIKESHQKYLSIVNSVLQDSLALRGLWQEIAIDLFDSIYKNWLPFDESLQQKGINSLITWFKFYIKRIIYGKKRLNQISSFNYNLWYVLLENRSHRTAITTVLGLRSGEIEDQRSEKSKFILESLRNL